MASEKMSDEDWRITKELLASVRKDIVGACSFESEEPEEHMALREVERECERARSEEARLTQELEAYKDPAWAAKVQAEVARLQELAAGYLRSLAARGQELEAARSQAADLKEALEAAQKRIEGYEHDCEMYRQRIEKLEAEILEMGTGIKT